MVAVEISGFGNIETKSLVLDYNGTLAKDGFLLDGVADLIKLLSEKLDVYVITADTFGSVAKEMEGLPVTIVHMGNGEEKAEKLSLIEKLGGKTTAAIGNGNNDELMIKEATPGICIMGNEGCSVKTLQAADLVVHDIRHALELFLFPKRLKATLRY